MSALLLCKQYHDEYFCVHNVTYFSEYFLETGITCRTVCRWDLYFFKVFDKFHVNTNFLVFYSTLEFYLSLKSMII